MPLDSRYIYISCTNQARPKQIFGASPLKTRDEPTDELICFPTTPLSSLSFFRLYLLSPSVDPPSSLPSRCLHSREYSSIYLKMTPITQVKYTRALIYCLSIVNLFHREIPGPPLHIHASAFLFFMTILNVRFTSGT